MFTCVCVVAVRSVHASLKERSLFTCVCNCCKKRPGVSEGGGPCLRVCVVAVRSVHASLKERSLFTCVCVVAVRSVQASLKERSLFTCVCSCYKKRPGVSEVGDALTPGVSSTEHVIHDQCPGN